MKKISKIHSSKYFRDSRYDYPDGDYDLLPIWVVTYPTERSEMLDIVFETDAFGFALQLNGGLASNEIALLTHKKSEAMNFARKLLNEVYGEKY